MMKFIVFVFAAICFVHANPVADDSDSTSGTQQGMYNTFGNWPRLQFPQLPQLQWPKMLTPQDIENMKPGPGAVMNGISQSVSSQTKYVDGKPVTDIKGETLLNKNGTIVKRTFED